MDAEPSNVAGDRRRSIEQEAAPSRRPTPDITVFPDPPDVLPDRADTGADVPAETESLWETVKSDFAGARGWRLLAVAGMLAWLAFQWGWGNDILLPPIVATAFDAVDDGTTWPSAAGAVGAGTLAGALFWGLTQTIDGVIVLSGISLLPGITQRISRFLRRQGWVKPFSELSLGTKFLIAYISGASVLCLVDVFATGEPGLRRRRAMLANAVGLAMAGVGLVVLIITTATVIGTRIPATSDAADVVIRYAKNPVTWLVIYGTIIGLSALKSRFAGDDAEAEESAR